jgi:hypothetical protein
VAAYYKKHPDKIDDQCSEDLIDTAMAIATATLTILDNYEILDTPESLKLLLKDTTEQLSKELPHDQAADSGKHPGGT